MRYGLGCKQIGGRGAGRPRVFWSPRLRLERKQAPSAIVTASFARPTSAFTLLTSDLSFVAFFTGSPQLAGGLHIFVDAWFGIINDALRDPSGSMIL